MIYKAHDRWNNREDELMHINGFKYILKLPIGKSFRYFYNQAEIAAYRAKKAVNNAVNTVRKLPGNIVKQYKTPYQIKQEYTKPGEKRYGSKESGNQSNLSHSSGTDEKGYKYVGKVKIDGKTRYFYSEEEYEAYKNRQFYQDDKNEPEFMKGFSELKDPRTAEEDSISVNTKYDPNSANKDFTTNCAECTMIYEMRRRGYDVEYNEKTNISGSDPYSESKNYNYDRRFSYCFENPETYKFRMTPSGEEFKTYMKKKFPPNSRGDISIEWKNVRSGHSMVWETDSKGNVKIRDAQVSGSGVETTWDPDALLKRSKNVRITRLDNLKPKNGITKIIQNRKSNPQARAASYDYGNSKLHQYSEEQVYKKYHNMYGNH